MSKRTQTALARSGALLTLVALVSAIGAGCGGKVIDTAKTEAALEQDLEEQGGKKISAVDCPSDVSVEPGATFECTVSYAGGEREVATLEIRNSDADVSVTDLRPERTAEKE